MLNLSQLATFDVKPFAVADALTFYVLVHHEVNKLLIVVLHIFSNCSVDIFNFVLILHICEKCKSL